MSEVWRHRLDDWRESIIDRLEEIQCLDMTHVEKLIIGYMIGRNDVPATDIEDRLKLSQPQVSIGLNDLEDKGLIKRRRDPESVDGKGRPRQLYSSTDQFMTYVKQSIDERITKLHRVDGEIRGTIGEYMSDKS